jgi:hypothetical protein
MSTMLTMKEKEIINQIVVVMRNSKPPSPQLESKERYLKWVQIVMNMADTLSDHNRHRGFDRDAFLKRCLFYAEDIKLWNN